MITGIRIFKTTMILFILIALIFLIACQPTPDTEVVVNKGDDSLMDIIGSSNSSSSHIVGEESRLTTEIWTQELNAGDNLKVFINATANIPDVSVFPVFQVEPDKFDVETVSRIKETLFGDAQLYYTDLAAGKIYTKAEIQDMIVSVKQELNDPGSDLNQMPDSEGKDGLRDAMEDELALLVKKYSNAPEEIEYKPIEITQENLEKGIFSIVRQDKGTIGFYVSDIDDHSGRHNSITCYYPRTDKYTILQYEELSQKQAEDTAEAFAEKLDAGMAINRTLLIDDNELNNYKCYDVIFTKVYDRIPETYTGQDQVDMAVNENTYTCPWSYEKLIVRVDNLGVWYFQWYSPSKVIKTISENVAMLSFNEIKEVFGKQIQYSSAWINEDDHIVLRKLYIDEIRLGMMRVSIKDRIDQYMLIPVWDFFGYTVDKYDAQQPGGYALDENNEYTNKVNACSFLTINAIDGSIINRHLGY